MLTIPSLPRRNDLQAFAVAIGPVAGMAIGCLLALPLATWGFAIGLGIGVIGSTVGLLRPQSMRRAYRGWSHIASLYMRAVRFAMKLACFFILILLRQRDASPLILTNPGRARSFWETRDRADHSGALATTNTGWCRSYVAWARQTGKWWALSLLPFLVVLAAVDTETDAATLSQTTYTLF